jgi:hypoxanthine phosphoribosyltransferase
VDPREQTEHWPGAPAEPDAPRGPRSGPAFAHASEAEFARILDFYQVAWEYEPHVFPILWDVDGNLLESFAPDFFLPELELFVELTTLQQRLVRKKNRKVRRLRELYPDLRIKLFYARDFRALMLKYGRSALVSELSGALGQVMPHPDDDGSPDSDGRLDGLDRAGGPQNGVDRVNPDPDGEQRPHYERRSRGARRRAVRRAAAAAAHTPATT